jgi:2-polyprenyl-3-methyl-5-hydroxy-6-metoxy-1,4-benzoquinol methylase
MDATSLALELFNQKAVEYQDKFMALELYHDSLDFFCSALETPNARVLDAACGPGNIAKYILQKRPDFIISGLDLAPNMIELAKVNVPEGVFMVMDCRLMRDLHQSFDGIICGFGLPYLSKADALQWIADAAALLNSGGLFYLSTIEGDYSQSGLKKTNAGNELYMFFHEADYLVKALKDSGLELVKIQRQDYPEQIGSTKIVDLILIAKK